MAAAGRRRHSLSVLARVVLAVILPLYARHVAAVRIITAQQGILQEVRRALKPTGPSLLTSWWSKNDCSKWLGVTCDVKGNVISLFLATEPTSLPDGSVQSPNLPRTGPRLDGTISEAVTRLTFLRRLVLTGHKLRGGIPATIGNLVNLQILWLNRNYLTGPLPASLGSLSKLQDMELSCNELSGSVPPEIVNLPTLSYLILATNHFVGGIPERSRKLQPINTMALACNNFTGTVPLWAFKGYYLDLSMNNFVGKIPFPIDFGFYFTYLYLDKNSFSGDAELPELEEARLDNNYFSSVQRSSKSPLPTASGNCLRTPGSFGKQKSDSECAKFCNSKQTGGACGEFGYCSGKGTAGATCTCERGYSTTAGNKFTCVR